MISRIQLQKLSQKLSPLCDNNAVPLISLLHKVLSNMSSHPGLTAAKLFIFQRQPSQSSSQTPLADTSCYPLQGK